MQVHIHIYRKHFMRSLAQHGSMLQSNEHFFYCTYSHTIRMNPYNYVVYTDVDGRWVCDPDTAIPILMKLDLFAILATSHELRWGHGKDIVEHLNTVLRKDIDERNW